MTHFLIYAVWYVCAVYVTWVVRGEVDARRLRMRDAVEAAARLGEKQWTVAGVVMPDPNDSRWRAEEQDENNGQVIRRVAVYRLGDILVATHSEAVYFANGVTKWCSVAEGGSKYAKEVIRCCRQRLVHESTKEPA